MHRAERMAEVLREEIGEIVGYELDDPRIQTVTVTDVRVADNLRNANVYVLVDGDESDIDQALAALQNAASFVRRQVALNLDLRFAPQLHFARDTVEENASKIEGILEDLSEDENFEKGLDEEE